MPEVKYDKSHPAGATPEARIANRFKNSGANIDTVDHHAVHGSGPTRAHTNVHSAGSAKSHGPDNKGEGDIFGRPRGPANSQGEIP
jgi:hypothetical protein